MEVNKGNHEATSPTVMGKIIIFLTDWFMTISLMLYHTWSLEGAFFWNFGHRWFCTENFKKILENLASCKLAIKSLSLNNVDEMTSGSQPLWLGYLWLIFIWLFVCLFGLIRFASCMSLWKWVSLAWKSTHNLKAYLQASKLSCTWRQMWTKQDCLGLFGS